MQVCYHPLSSVSGRIFGPIHYFTICSYLPSTSCTYLARVWTFSVRKRVIKLKRTRFGTPEQTRHAEVVKDSPHRLDRQSPFTFMSTAHLIMRIAACPVFVKYAQLTKWRRVTHLFVVLTQ